MEPLNCYVIRTVTESTEVTPTDNCNSSSKELSSGSSSSVATGSGSNNVTTLPTQEEVVRKTEKITRKLQELFHLAQEGKHEL